jgi:hypothetical protein
MAISGNYNRTLKFPLANPCRRGMGCGVFGLATDPYYQLSSASNGPLKPLSDLQGTESGFVLCDCSAWFLAPTLLQQNGRNDRDSACGLGSRKTRVKSCCDLKPSA